MKQTLYKRVRKRYNLSNHENKNFFSKTELMKIVSKIYGEEKDWTRTGDYMTDHLTTYGWTEQATTDTHPSTKNLEWLLCVPTNSKKTTKTYAYKPQLKRSKVRLSLLEVINSIEPNVMEKVESISIDKLTKAITIKF